MKQNTMLSVNDLMGNDELDYINSIWSSIMKMETGFINILLKDHIDYENIGKDKFVEKLNETFNKHKTLGDSEFFLDLNYCNECNCNTPVCKFVGNVSGKHFALIFEMKDEEISDIYHCNSYGDNNFLDSF
jgi:hypothetical protein